MLSMSPLIVRTFVAIGLVAVLWLLAYALWVAVRAAMRHRKRPAPPRRRRRAHDDTVWISRGTKKLLDQALENQERRLMSAWKRQTSAPVWQHRSSRKRPERQFDPLGEEPTRQITRQNSDAT